MIAALLVALTSFLGCSIAAQAHQINLTNARLVVGPDRTVDVEIAMKGSDADRVAGTRVFDDKTGLVRPAAVTAASASIVAYVEGHTAVLGGDGMRPGRSVRNRLPTGGEWIRTFRSGASGEADAILPVKDRPRQGGSAPPGSECCVVVGYGGCEAYTVIGWGGGLSHEISNVAEAETLGTVEGNMCGIIMRDASVAAMPR